MVKRSSRRGRVDEAGRIDNVTLDTTETGRDCGASLRRTGSMIARGEQVGRQDTQEQHGHQHHRAKGGECLLDNRAHTIGQDRRHIDAACPALARRTRTHR